MAICRIIKAGATPEEYERVSGKLGLGDGVPPGATLHVAAQGDDGKITIVELWDSRDDAEAFSEKVRAAREAAGVGGDGPPEISYYEVHRVRRAAG